MVSRVRGKAGLVCLAVLSLSLSTLAQPNGNCLMLTGQGHYVKVPYTAALNAGANLTIAGWAYMTSQTRFAGFICKAGADDVYSEFTQWQSYALNLGNDLDATNDKFRVSVTVVPADTPSSSTNFAFQGAAATTSMATATWVHAAAVFNGSSVTLYIDGTPVDTNDFAGTPGVIQQNGSDLFFGMEGPGSADFWTGAIDEIMLWHRALSAAEITKAMARDTVSLTASMLGYWNFNESSGSIVKNVAPATVGTLDGTVRVMWGTNPVADLPSPFWMTVAPTAPYAIARVAASEMHRATPGAEGLVRLAANNGTLALDVTSSSMPTVALLTPQGKCVASLAVTSTADGAYRASMSASSLPRGTYIASVRTQGREVARMQIAR